MVEVPGSRVPLVWVQLLVVRMVPVRVRVPDGLLMLRLGRVPALVVALPVNVWAPVPSMVRRPVAPSKVDAWVMSPRAETVPTIDPLVRVVVAGTVTEPLTVNATAVGMVRLATVSAVPVGTVTAPRIWIVLRVWVPVMVRVPA